MNKERFAENLRCLRLRKGLTQERLAEELQISPQSVSRWECGNTLPDVLQLPKLARIYGVTVEDLYREEITSYPNYAQRLLAVYEVTGKTEDFLIAEQEFFRLLDGEHTPDDLRSFGVLYHYMTKYCFDRAVEYLDAAVSKADRSNWVWSSAAQQKLALLNDLGRGAEEAARCDQELSQHPADEQCWLLCIVAHYFIDDNEKALSLAQEAITKFPSNALFYLNAGSICQALKRYDEAFAYWNRVLELDETVLTVYYSMGSCYEELNEYDKALRIWNELSRKLIGRGLTQEYHYAEEHAKSCRKQMDL